MMGQTKLAIAQGDNPDPVVIRQNWTTNGDNRPKQDKDKQSEINLL